MAGVIKQDNLEYTIKTLSLTAEIILTFTAVGNLTKLRHLSKLQKGIKIIIAGVELSSSSLDIIINYTDVCNGQEELCSLLQEYNSYLQMGLIGGEVVSALYRSNLLRLKNRASAKYAESRNNLIFEFDEDELKQLDEHFGYSIAKGAGKLSKSNLLDVPWKNNIIGHRSSTSALDFWKNTSKEFDHLIDGDFYLKFDNQTGNLLFGNHKSGEIFGFYEGAKNIEIVNNKGLDGILGKLKIYHGTGSPSYVNLNVSSGARIITNPDKTATIVGNYKRFPWHQGDMKELIPELLGDLKTQQFGPKKGGFNVLNVADEVVTDWNKFWNDFNKPWIEAAIARGDNIWAASNPMEINLLFKRLDRIPLEKIDTHEKLAEFLKSIKDPVILDQITGFGNEIKLLSENGYVYNQATKMFVK